MKVRNFVFGALAVLMTLVSCQNEVEELGFPKLVLDTDEMTFDVDGGTHSLAVTSTRDWSAEYEEDWIAITPKNGTHASGAQTVTVTVLENTGLDREASIKFTINMTSKYLTVKQAGPEGSADQLILYYNDYDKEVAEKVYGSGTSWPYLDQFEGWKNETGSGAAGITYAFSGMSARANSTSNSNYADYPGSGNNNLFFGSNAYIATKNIALNGNTDLVLTFGTEKYSQDNGSIFRPSEFHIYLSQDGSKWVEFTEYTFAGGETEGRWNLATALFSVPAGTENLSVCMKADVASSYRMDDLRLEVSMSKGTAVDFTNAVEMDFSANSSGGGGGEVTPPSGIKDVTVEQFNAAAVSTTEWYRLKGTVGGPINAQYGNFDLIDATGKVYVYGISNWAEYVDKVAEGGEIVVVGNRGDYNGKIEVLKAYIESYGGTSGGGNEGGNEGGNDGDYSNASAKTVAEFIASADESTYFKLTGTVSNFGSTYCDFDLTDESGTIYVYSVANKSDWASRISNGGKVVLAGKYKLYSSKHEVVEAYILSFEGANTGGGDEGGDNGNDDNTGTAGEYESTISWSLGANAYDNTSSTPQKAKVNGVSVDNVLKLGKSNFGGDCTITVPAGTKKIGFYAVSWKGKTTNLTLVDKNLSVSPKSNTGATGNPEPEYIITVTEDDYYEFEVNLSSEAKLKLATDSERALIFGLKAIE